MPKDWKKIIAEKKFHLLGDKKLEFTYPYASKKDVQAPEEAFSP